MNIPGTQIRPDRFLLITNLALALILIIVTLVLMRDIVTVMVHKRKGIETTLPKGHAGTKTMKRAFHEYEPIMKHNPFGAPEGSLSLLSGSAAEPQASADVKLLGTIAGGERFGYAIFSDNSARQEVFRVGDPVFGAGKLKRVDKDKATVMRDSGPFEIPLVDIALIQEMRPSQAREASPKAEASAFARNVARDTYIVDQKAILHALENPNQLMTDARLQPNLASGRQEGFVLREVKSGGIYHSLGLQNGDVLLRINNYDISHPDNALQAFTALRGMDRVALVIVRNGTKMTLNYQIK